MIDIQAQAQKAFSKKADKYHDLSYIQKGVGRALLHNLKRDTQQLRNILDIGMGTGWLTEKVTESFPAARVIGVDFSSGMVRQARSRYSTFSVVQADARHLPFAAGTFDLIYSNVALQWVSDLTRAFYSLRRCLTPEGVFHATIFGEKTLNEVFASLAAVAENDFQSLALPTQRLRGKGEVQSHLVAAGFRAVSVEEQIVRVPFPSMLDIIRWVKNIGADGNKQRLFLGRDFLLRANEYYRQNFGAGDDVFASFEIFWVAAQK